MIPCCYMYNVTATTLAFTHHHLFSSLPQMTRVLLLILFLLDWTLLIIGPVSIMSRHTSTISPIAKVDTLALNESLNLLASLKLEDS